MSFTVALERVQGAKYLWCTPTHPRQQIMELAQSYNFAAPLIETLLTRGLQTRAEIDRFLFTSEQEVEDPCLMKDAERAVARIEQSIARGEKILIAGDYDVDGVTSTALLLTCLVPLGAHINFFLPHRQRDGYGLSAKTVARAAAHHYRVIITVDNGITAHEPARVAREHNIDLIITDHHRPHDTLPDAYAIVDPHQQDCTYPFKYFAGVGVSFKLMSLLYRRRNQELPAKVYELLLFGTVADVVPLKGENRFWVRHGLNHINNSAESLALGALKQNARFTKSQINSRDIGFYFAPQINALGRLDDARAAVAFLLGSDAQETTRVAALLKSMNEQRKLHEQTVIQDILDALRAGALSQEDAVLVATGKRWQPGVVGLAASRLVSLFGKPAIIMHETEEGILKGSCRSIPEINIFELLHSVRDLLISFGGHPVAAGLSLPLAALPEFRHRIDQLVRSQVDVSTLKQRIYLDAELRMSEITHTLLKQMEYLEPFGADNREPLFYIRDIAQVQEPQLLKNAHVKCMVFADGVLKPLMFFGRPELYDVLKDKGTTPFTAAVTLNENHWNGKVSIDLFGTDIL